MSRPRVLPILLRTAAALLSASPLVSATIVPAADPPILIAGQSTLTTITAYIPDEPRRKASVSLYRVIAGGLVATRLGALSDNGTGADEIAGDQVYSIRINLTEQIPGEANFRIAVYNSLLPPRSRVRHLSYTAADFSISVISVPMISNATHYNETVVNLFTAALEARSAVQLIQSQPVESTSPEDYQRINDSRLSLYVNLQAILDFEASIDSATAINTAVIHGHSALQEGSPRFIFGLVDISLDLFNEGRAGAKELTDIQSFIENGTADPRTAEIAAWTLQNSCLEEYQLMGDLWRQDRETCADVFQVDRKRYFSKFRSLGKISLKVPLQEAATLIGEGLGQLFELVTIGVEATKGAVGKILDFFIIPEAQAQGLLLAEVTNPGTLEVPAGQNDLIYSFGGSDPRARITGVIVPPNETVELQFSPGDSIRLNEPPPGAVDQFLGPWVHTGCAQGCSSWNFDTPGLIEIGTSGSNIFVRFGDFRDRLSFRFPDVWPDAVTSFSDADDGSLQVSWTDIPVTHPNFPDGGVTADAEASLTLLDNPSRPRIPAPAMEVRANIVYMHPSTSVTVRGRFRTIYSNYAKAGCVLNSETGRWSCPF